MAVIRIIKEKICPAGDDVSHWTNKFPLVKLGKLFKIFKYSKQLRHKSQNYYDISDEKIHFPDSDISTR